MPQYGPVKISCLCGQTAQEVTLDLTSTSSISFCHCTSCRLTSGQLCTSYLDLQSPPSLTSNLTKYPEAADVDRWFCRTCGAHVFLQLSSQGVFLVAAGLVAAGPTRLTEIRHRCAANTADGGLASFLRGSGQHPLPVCYTGLRDETSYAAQDQQQYPSGGGHYSNRTPRSVSGAGEDAETRPQTKLFGRCHCGSVEYHITPPDESSRLTSSPWPDLLAPYHSASSDNPEDLKWWICEEEGTAGDNVMRSYYLAGLCACVSCRLASGFPLQSWAFVPLSNIFKADGSPLSTYDITILQRYESSPGIYREFCGKCGATVFWNCEARPGVVDVSVGLLQASSGVRAEDWLRWVTNRISFSEDAVSQGLILALQDGLKVWGEEKNGGR